MNEMDEISVGDFVSFGHDYGLIKEISGNILTILYEGGVISEETQKVRRLTIDDYEVMKPSTIEFLIEKYLEMDGKSKEVEQWLKVLHLVFRVFGE